MILFIIDIIINTFTLNRSFLILGYLNKMSLFELLFIIILLLLFNTNIIFILLIIIFKCGYIIMNKNVNNRNLLNSLGVMISILAVILIYKLSYQEIIFNIVFLLLYSKVFNNSYILIGDNVNG